MDERIKIGLCDDEKNVHENIEKIMEKYQRKRECDLEIIHFFSAKELLKNTETLQILLLDIDMPQMDGIEVAFRLREQGKICRIIMLTVMRERFKDAFKIGAYRFVTKPIDVGELEEALDAARNTLLGYKQVEMRFGTISCKVFQYQIDCLQARGDYLKIYVGDKIYESTRSLKSWKEELDSRLFIDCHKSYIVNLRSISKFAKDTLLLANGEKIPIARRRRRDVLQAFIEFDTKNSRV